MNTFLSRWTPPMLSIFRFMAGLLFLEHGTSKILNIPPADPSHGPLVLASLMGFGAILELVGGTLLVLGLFTRISAFILSGQMAVAYFMVHFAKGFFPVANGGELAALYCFAFLYLAFAGGGPWSLDRLVRRV